MDVFAHTLIIIMPGLNARGLQSKLLILCHKGHFLRSYHICISILHYNMYIYFTTVFIYFTTVFIYFITVFYTYIHIIICISILHDRVLHVCVVLY